MSAGVLVSSEGFLYSKVGSSLCPLWRLIQFVVLEAFRRRNIHYMYISSFVILKGVYFIYNVRVWSFARRIIRSITALQFYRPGTFPIVMEARCKSNIMILQSMLGITWEEHVIKAWPLFWLCAQCDIHSCSCQLTHDSPLHRQFVIE